MIAALQARRFEPHAASGEGVSADTLLQPLFVFLAALSFYAFTLAPTVVWGDSASISWRAWSGQLRIGTAEDHPVFLAVGWLFSHLPGEVARNVNLASAFFGALAVAVAYTCARLLGASRIASLTGAAALAVSHAFWLHSVIAEVYSANALFLLATVALLLKWRKVRRARWLAGAFGMLVVGLANHLVLATAFPAMAAFVAMVAGRALFTRRVVLPLAALGLVVVALVVVPPPSVAAAFDRLWNGEAPISEYVTMGFEPLAVAREAGFYSLFLAYQFPSLSLVLGLVGGLWLVRRDRAAAVLLILAIAANAAIFVRHTVWPSTSGTKYVFYIADYALFAVLCAVGTDLVVTRMSRIRSRTASRVAFGLLAVTAVIPPIVYAAVPKATRAFGLELFSARAIAYRDNTTFFLNPNKRGDVGARRFAEEAFAILPPNAVLFADHTPYTALRYLQLTENVRPDVLVPPLRGSVVRVQTMKDDDDGQSRPLYIAASPRPGYYDLSGLIGGYTLVRSGPIFEVRTPVAMSK